METVNHPAHYGGEDDPFEPIKIIEAKGYGFHRGNALKYLMRAGVKSDDPVEDLRKAVWYIEREIAQEGNGNSVDESEEVEKPSAGRAARQSSGRVKRRK